MLFQMPASVDMPLGFPVSFCLPFRKASGSKPVRVTVPEAKVWRFSLELKLILAGERREG